MRYHKFSILQEAVRCIYKILYFDYCQVSDGNFDSVLLLLATYRGICVNYMALGTNNDYFADWFLYPRRIVFTAWYEPDP